MNPNKFLVTITNKSQINILKKARVTNFLFPLKDFAVGFPNTFPINDITENSYIYINRLLDNKDYQNLKIILTDLPDHIKGIVFEDFGVITIAKELNIKKELILYQTHFATNSTSINENLEFVNSIVISTDITENEINQILSQANKPLVYMLYGLVPAMYSRRTLLTNFETEFNTDMKTIVKLEEVVNKSSFIAVENEYGTILYHDKFLNGQISIPDEKVKFYLINTLLIEDEELEKILKDFINNQKILLPNETRGFLDTPTIYRLKEVSREQR